jgi:hypothetical protein
MNHYFRMTTDLLNIDIFLGEEINIYKSKRNHYFHSISIIQRGILGNLLPIPDVSPLTQLVTQKGLLLIHVLKPELLSVRPETG